MRPKLKSNEEIDLIGSLSAAAAGKLLGVTGRTLHNWHAPRRSDGRYDATALVRWYVEREREAEALLAPGSDSPGLERYRLARAALVELQLEREKQTVLPVDRVRETLGRWAGILRRAGERLRQRHGNDAGDVLADALEECRKVIETELPKESP
jgi:hypothetical protein